MFTPVAPPPEQSGVEVLPPAQSALSVLRLRSFWRTLWIWSRWPLVSVPVTCR